MCVGFAPKNDSFASFWERQDVFLKRDPSLLSFNYILTSCKKLKEGDV